jgi:predicted metal-dependent peptidase
MHIVLQHLGRGQGRDRLLFNVANDIIVNDILVTDNIELPPDGLIPQNHSFQIDKNLTITEIDKKSSEDIYEILFKYVKKMQKQNGNGNGKGNGGGDGQSQTEKSLDSKRFDEHMGGNGSKSEEEKDGKGEGIGREYTQEELEKASQDWKKRLAMAADYAKMRGLLPAGMERLVDGLLESKVDWRHKLYKYITDSLPVDFTYCVDKNTEIITPTGTKKISKLKVGDKICGYKEGKIVVTKVMKKFSDIQKEEKVIVYTGSGKQIICSSEHRFFVGGKYIKAKDLNTGDILIRVEDD